MRQAETEASFTFHGSGRVETHMPEANNTMNTYIWCAIAVLFADAASQAFPAAVDDAAGGAAVRAGGAVVAAPG